MKRSGFLFKSPEIYLKQVNLLVDSYYILVALRSRKFMNN